MPPVANGANLGNAQGKISIDVQDLQRIQALTQQVGQTVARNLGQIDSAAKRTQASTNSLANSLGSMVGAFGIATGAAALVAQMTRMAVQADAVATAYRRQNVAAVGLAGNQRELNTLLTAYNQVTGNVIDKAQALADVTRLQAVGFADDAEELKAFAVAARGISIAMGAQQDYVIGQLQLAIANQSTLRLDQIGLGVAEVAQRVKDLKAADSTLSTEMAYQNAVLGIATEKYGTLATSLEAQATGAEKAAKAWKDLQLQMGETLGPAVGGLMGEIARQLDVMAESARRMGRDMEYLKSTLSSSGWTMPEWLKSALLVTGKTIGIEPIGATPTRTPSLEESSLARTISARQNQASYLSNNIANLRSSGAPASVIARQEEGLRQVNTELAQFKAQLMLASGAAQRFGGGLDLGLLPRATPSAVPGARTYSDDQTAAIQQWARDVKAIEADAAAARLDATRQFEQQRAETISSHNKTILREEADFARNRARAIADQAKAVAQVQEDAAKREADAAADYAKAVARLQRDAGRRDAKWLEDYNEKVADLRQAGNERLTELEADYNKSRERAATDHRDRLMDAAARLDAVAVRDEQRNYARQQQDAKENYDEQRSDIQKALDKQLADALEAQEERLADAREGDQERLSDMQEAMDEQRREAKQADAERLADMQAAFDERLAREDEERQIQNARRDEDHADQMAQMAAAQAERMAKIAEQTAKEKAEQEAAFLEELNGLGLHNENWLSLQNARQARSLALFDEFWKGIEARMGPQGPELAGWLTDFTGGRTIPAQSAGGSSGGSSRTVNIGDGAIRIYGTAGQSEAEIARLVRDEMIQLLEGVQ